MRQAWRRGLSLVLVLVLVFGWVAHADDGLANWTSSSQRALRLVGPATTDVDHPVLETNLSCARISYQLIGQGAANGCFSLAAFGFMNLDNSTVLFTGSDHATSLQPLLNNQLLVPWPGTEDMLVLNPVSTGGVALGLYDNILADLSDTTNSLGQIISKRITVGPDRSLRSADGQLLVINPQTLAFSPGGAWMIAETLSGVFVRLNLDSLTALPFAPAFGALGNAIVGNAQVAVSADGRYVAIENTIMTSFRIYDLSSCANQTLNGLRLLNCSFGDYWPFVNGQLASLTQLSDMHFVGDGILAFNATSSAGYNTYEMAPTGSINSLLGYLGTGDSYTSGEGAFDYLSGTDTSDNHCHLSANSYPILLARDLFAGGGNSVACSGAKIGDIVAVNPGSYRGQLVNGRPRAQRDDTEIANLLASFTPGNLPQADFISAYQPGVLTVSVGGNNIGFGDILRSCVAPHIGLQPSSNTCYSSYEDRLELKNLIDRTVPRWTALYQQLVRASPLSHIYVIGYPQIAKPGGNCALNVHLNASELTFAEELIDYLNSSIQSAAQLANVPYVDISQALVGHRLCEAPSYDVAVNGLTAGGLDRPISAASYHPNALGQALIEQAIIKKTQRFKVVETAVTSRDVTELLAAPASGRAVNALALDDSLTATEARPGQTITIKGGSDGLLANSVYTLKLDGATGATLGTLSSDDSGSVAGNVTLPIDTAAGNHSLDLSGPGLDGQTVDVRQFIYIFASTSSASGGQFLSSQPTIVTHLSGSSSGDVLGVKTASPNQMDELRFASTFPDMRPLVNSSAQSNLPVFGVDQWLELCGGAYLMLTGLALLHQIYWRRRHFTLQ